MNENDYLTNMPQELETWGFCKVLMVRHELIHLKHILTEAFVRKTGLDFLKELDWSVEMYMFYIVNRFRHIMKISRQYSNDINEIVKAKRNHFFPTLELYNGLNNVIVLDFDGVVSKNSFAKLYELCIERGKVEICTANPTVTEERFTKKGLSLPNKINARKGKLQKLKCLVELSRKYDFVFYIDDEERYLKVAWMLGIKTFIYKDNKIKHYSLNSK